MMRKTSLLLSGFGFAILAVGGALRTGKSRGDVIVDKSTPKTIVAPTPAPTV